MLGGLGFGELMVILVIVLVLFGARRVPEIAASFGKGIREFKRNINDAEQQIREPLRESRAQQLGASDPVASQHHDEESRPEPKRLL